MSREEVFFLALTLIKGLGNSYRNKLISYFSSYEKIFDASIKELKKSGLREELCKEVTLKKTIKEAENLISFHEKKNVKIITQVSKIYPTRLLHIHNAPGVLFYKGNLNLNQKKIISIVGTRKVTAVGKNFIEKFISDLENSEILIVSGLAYGVDIEAHKCSLNKNLKTLAIYGGGIDMVYPSDHKKYADEIESSGGLITEYPLGTKVEAYQFVERNRIIAGVSDATIVVEAPNKSGALLTAEYANQCNREVFAVPGSVFEKNYEGAHKLIKLNLARLITSAEDLLNEMNWIETSKAPQQKKISLDDLNLSDDEKKIVALIKNSKNKKIHIDDLHASENFNSSSLASLLLQLEISEIISSLPGRFFSLKE